MKKIWITCLAMAALVACNNDSSKGSEEVKTTTPTEEPKPAADDLSSNPDYQKGLGLVAKSDCLTCHKVDEQYTGPSYREIANKYASEAPGVIPKLADKIIEGGSGVWGQVPMLPHKNISKDDAEAMVKYILLLKK